MRFHAALLATVLAVPSVLPAQTGAISSADREMLQKDLAKSSEVFLASVEGLTEAQWRFKPAPNRWSIAETAEHIVAANRLIAGMLTANLSPISPHSADSAAAVDERVRRMLADRTTRFDAPPVIQPSGSMPSGAELVAAYRSSRDSLVTWVGTTRDPLRALGLPHPALGPLDGVQWIILIAGHDQRHTQQIEEVKRADGYPAP